MLRSNLLCGAAIALVSAMTAVSASAKESFTTFDPTGSVYTFASGINASGTVAGYYEDSKGVTHGFLRTSDGTITAFDPPGSTLTQVTGINANGDIAGWYRDGGSTFRSFVRAADGTITKFNPTKGLAPSTIGLNANGMVAGWYAMLGNQKAGFVGAPDGKMKQLTVEGVAINANGVVTGVEGSQGFVRSNTGKTVSFVGPGNPDTTTPTSINDPGTVAGYDETICGISYGFTRDSAGAVTAVSPPNSYYTFILGINDKNVLTGYYYYGGYHGFVRDGSGAFTTFDITGATDGTYPQSINAKGEVAGGYRDSNNLLHGFVGKP
jgi:probable HAF family extracellular repeat protein